jgi:hypothetical protein
MKIDRFNVVTDPTGIMGIVAIGLPKKACFVSVYHTKVSLKRNLSNPFHRMPHFCLDGGQVVSADAVYNTKRNQEEIAAIGAEAFIPFKGNHSGKQGGLWGEKFRQWHEDREYFLKHYHQRSNVETNIMMWKTSFGDSLRSKTEIATKNELYCKLICHNLSCLIKAMYELGLGAEFLIASFRKGGESILSPW